MALHSLSITTDSAEASHHESLIGRKRDRGVASPYPLLTFRFVTRVPSAPASLSSISGTIRTMDDGSFATHAPTTPAGLSVCDGNITVLILIVCEVIVKLALATTEAKVLQVVL
jgi:hypothetical protein